MTTAVAVIRLVLAGVFVVSAVAKFRDREGARSGVEAFGVPVVLVAPVATLLPFAELVCALLLVLGDPWATIGAVGSLLLLMAFTVAIVANLVQGRRPECHCFGSLGDAGGIGWDTVARNGVLIVLAALSLVGAGGLRFVPAVLLDLDQAAGLTLLAAGVVAALLAAMALALRTLMTRYGTLLLRLEAVEQVTGLAAPRTAPAFALPDLDGEQVSLADVLAEGKPALVAFVSPTCHNCADLLPDLSAWQSDPDHPMSVLVLSDGSVEDNLSKIEGAAPLRVLLMDGRQLSDDYEVLGTPAAVIVDVNGSLVGPPVHAVDGVRGLHASILGRLGGQADHAHDPAVHIIGARPVSPGDEAPDTLLTDETGTELAVSAALPDESVVLFWRIDCGFCQQILEDVRELETTTRVRVITTSDVAELRATGIGSPVLQDLTGSFEAWLQVPGTPSAARLRDGVLDSTLAVGGPDVLALLRASAQTDLLVD